MSWECLATAAVSHTGSLSASAASMQEACVQVLAMHRLKKLKLPGLQDRAWKQLKNPGARGMHRRLQKPGSKSLMNQLFKRRRAANSASNGLAGSRSVSAGLVNLDHRQEAWEHVASLRQNEAL